MIQDNTQPAAVPLGHGTAHILPAYSSTSSTKTDAEIREIRKKMVKIISSLGEGGLGRATIAAAPKGVDQGAPPPAGAENLKGAQPWVDAGGLQVDR